MTDDYCAHPSAGSEVCELPSLTIHHAPRTVAACPACGKRGTPVQGQTVKAIVSETLRQARQTEYLFCRTHSCPVVYFSVDGTQTFTVEQVRERVYQKELETDDVLICYCFRHTAGEVRSGSPAARASIVDDINAGIQADQCACDLRNPQGSCCLGNVRALVRELEPSTATP